MFIYDISLSTVGLRPNLPPVTDWLRPKYSGPGDLISRQESNTVPGDLNDPQHWKEEFPDFNYTFDENIELKQQLNAAKNKITPIRENPADDRKFNAISTACNRYEDLRGRRGVLVRNYGAEIVTNAWMKMYECMSLLEEPLLARITKSRNAKEFNTFHIAEAPGNFMLAINHYLYSHHSNIEWSWLANSYRDLYTKSITGDPRLANSHYLEDAYGLIAGNPDRWIFGADSDGDITSTANIKSFAHTVERTYGGTGLHFLTSDVKFVPIEVNYDEEEFQNVPVQMGHMLSSLATLRKGGVCMLKEFTFFEAPKMSHLYLLANCFEKVQIVKPVTSRPANSEVYVFGIGYRKNLTELQMDALYDAMEYVRFLTDESPSIFKRSDIPDAFVQRVHEMNKMLVGKQVPAIERNVALFDEYEYASHQDICRDVASIRAESAQQWIKKYGIKDMPKKNRISDQ